jgi:hypothetical protein
MAGETLANTTAVRKFIPELWSGRLISNLQKSMVYGNLVNRDYEGDISGAGDTVHVPNIGRINVIDYVRYGTLGAPQKLTDGENVLTITEAKAFNFEVDDIDKAQAKGSIMEEAMKESAYSMGDDADQFIASLYPQATQGAGLADALTTNKNLFYELLVGIRRKFRELNVPINELVTVIPPIIEEQVLLDSRLIHATASGDTVLRNGEVGRLAGHTLVVSNNVPVETSVNYKLLTYAGKQAVTFADQINKTEAYRPEDGFKDAVKGLHVYGANTMRKEFVVCSNVEMA